MTDTELAYIAGIIDGEGCIEVYSHKSNKYAGYRTTFKLSVTNTELILIRWILNTTGIGAISTFKNKDENHKVAYRWNICARQAGTFLRLIRPWLIVKAGQADVALALDAMELAEGTKCGKRPSEALQTFRLESVTKIKALKHSVLVA